MNIRKINFSLISKILICLSFILYTHALSANEIAIQKIKVHESYPWFKQSFLDLVEDVSDAKRNNKGLILYFYQDGCPYCKKLLNDNFAQPELVNKLRNQYDFIAINMWGDRDVIDVDGDELTEKLLAVKLNVMFTPTLLFINKNSGIEFRLNGYYSPAKFHTLLDYLAQLNNKVNKYNSFFEYYTHIIRGKKRKAAKQVINRSAVGKNYSIMASQLPLLVLFEESSCDDCNELGQMIRHKPQISELFKRFTLSRVDIHSKQIITDTEGRKNSNSKWADDLQIQYTPTLVFFIKDETTGIVKEIFRADSYLKTFHLESVMLYIADKHYIRFPEFQRYIHERVDQLEEKGIKIDLWE